MNEPPWACSSRTSRALVSKAIRQDVLAEIVRLDRSHHRPIAGDSDNGEAMKPVARSHQSMIWDRTRHVLRLRSALREYFPAALNTFDDLDAPDALALLAAAPDPDRAARLSTARISTALRKANRRDVPIKALEIQGILRTPALRQPPRSSKPSPPLSPERSG